MAPRKSRRKSSKRARLSRATLRVGPAFEKLVGIMARLRAPNGCPWDREQTHATLRTYLIEEAYEVLDALDSTDDAKFAEELGDLLLQILFHAQIANEEHRFNISDVIREIYEKMIRRHPHVFGTKRAKTAAEVLRNWEIIKSEERRQKEAKEVKEVNEVKDKTSSSASFTSSTSSAASTSLLDGVPRSLPALLEAFQLTRKAARIGFDWDSVEGIFDKLDEETRELRHALAHSGGTAIPGGAQASPSQARGAHKVRSKGIGGRSFSSGIEPSVTKGASAPEESDSSGAPSTPSEPARRSFSEGGSIESELGDILFVAVNLARFLNIDPEVALKKTSSKFSRRFREMERLAREHGTTLAQVPRPQMESLWDQAKLRELSPSALKTDNL